MLDVERSHCGTIKASRVDVSFSVCRFSAIHCASAVPMSSVESQQRETHRASTPEPEHKKPSMNGQATAAPKASAKPKGIMGLFAEKQAPKTQETSKVLKREQKEHAAVVQL